MADGKFEKPASMGVSLETGYFSEDGLSGFGLSTFAGRLSIRFWKKGEKSSENRDNTLSLNLNQAMLLGQMLRYAANTRIAALASGGIESYPDLTSFNLTLDGNVNGQMVVFGVVRIDTVSVEGIKRIKLSVLRNKTENSCVFCDKFFKSAVEDGAGFKKHFDPLEISFLRFVQEVETYVTMQWQYASISKIFTTIIKPNGGNNNGGNRSSNHGGHSSAPRRYEDTSSSSSPVFDDDGSEF